MIHSRYPYWRKENGCLMPQVEKPDSKKYKYEHFDPDYERDFAEYARIKEQCNPIKIIGENTVKGRKDLVENLDFVFKTQKGTGLGWIDKEYDDINYPVERIVAVIIDKEQKVDVPKKKLIGFIGNGNVSQLVHEHFAKSNKTLQPLKEDEQVGIRERISENLKSNSNYLNYKVMENKAAEIIQTQEEYINLLIKEIDSLVGSAYVHGWRSQNVEEGGRLRNKIASLKSSQSQFQSNAVSGEPKQEVEQTELYRWVKYSERKPNETGEYIIRCTDQYAAQKGVEYLLFDKNEGGFMTEHDEYFNLEWLEPLPKEQPDFDWKKAQEKWREKFQPKEQL